MMDSIKTPFPELVGDVRAHVKLDPGFKAFVMWTKSVHMPVIFLSSGTNSIIWALLVYLIGLEAKDIEIVCNDVQDRPPKTKEREGGWQIKIHDDGEFSHEKGLAIRPYAEKIGEMPLEKRPTTFCAGDGVSDLSVARETDLLFAKSGRGMSRRSPSSSCELD
jgi:2-hydroxy-3-keto-5-methylthiopentenyl-1-phosphate phosphatase